MRIRPSGHRSFVYRPRGDGGARRITLGSAALMGVEEARRSCLAIETGARPDRSERRAVPTFEEFVAGAGRTCIERCKASTQKAERWMLKARLLPAFGSSPLDRITRAGVTRWFDEYSRTAPGGANHGLNLLRRILNHAVVCGHLDTNPVRGIRRNPRPKLTRFLSREEVRRLHHELDRHGSVRPSRARQADIIRLLLLTGCRRNEIVTVRWQDIDGNTLNLADAKGGPRTVLLSAPARAILERQPRSGSACVFPSPLDPGRPLSSGLPLWRSVRKLLSLPQLVRDLRSDKELQEALGGVIGVELQKPLFQMGVRDGPCLPDVLLTVTRPGRPVPRVSDDPFDDGDRARYVFEVMGFDDAKYEEQKEKTHRRMERLGRVIRLEGQQFGSNNNGLERQRDRIARQISKDLIWRWTGS